MKKEPTRQGRSRIEKAALEEFLAKGYSGARTKTISDRAKVSEGNLFWHFGTKAKLFESLMRPVREELFAHFEQSTNALGRVQQLGGASPQIAAVTEGTVSLMRTRRRALRVLLTAAQNTPFEGTSEEFVQAIAGLIRREMERYAPERAQGIDPFCYEMLAVGFVNGFVRILGRWQSTLWAREMYDHLVHLCLAAGAALSGVQPSTAPAADHP